MKSGFGRCRSCGGQVLWIRMKSGKAMPVDPCVHSFRKKEDGSQNIVTEYGEVVRGEFSDYEKEGADGVGYISHFASCPAAGMHRKR